MQILKCFHSVVICTVASDYYENRLHENNEVKDFLAQNFWLGCLRDFRKLPRI